MNVVIKIVKMLSPEELKKLPGLVGLMFFMALLDAIGVASIMPFIAVVADHNILYNTDFYKLLESFHDLLHLQIFFFL